MLKYKARWKHMKNFKDNLKDLVNHVYQYDLFSGISEDVNIEIEDLETQEIFNDIILELNNLDDIINENLFNYQLERIGYLDRAIIRVATYELKNTDTATSLIINSAIELTKTYSDLEDEKQHKFTNKLLDNISKFLRG